MASPCSPSSKLGLYNQSCVNMTAKSSHISVDPQYFMNWPRLPLPLSIPTTAASPRHFLGLRACPCLGASWALCPDASALPSGAMEWLKYAKTIFIHFPDVSSLNKLKDGWNTSVFAAKLFETRSDCDPQPIHPCWPRLEWLVYVGFDVQVLQEFSAHDAAAFCWVGMSQSSSHVVIHWL